MMKSKLLAVILAVILMIFIIGLIQPARGCVQQISLKSNQPQENWLEANLGSPIQLRINQTAIIKPENLRVKFLKVSEDSRCPSGVFCVQEGQVTIVFNILKEGQNLGDSIRLTRRAFQENLAVKNWDGYSIKLIKVDPEPKANQTIKSSDYLVTIVVSKV